ncbi:carcinine transporter-like isoform X1 [Cydia pomonella]|uniref:carcinine transporter-like isoform X1 n=1 Tax=Cydia pomonella TaxID=82600 RepID=UPI002ADD9B61|nr:carcinine transporter-like isoform X1 [Cydia pomonella]
MTMNKETKEELNKKSTNTDHDVLEAIFIYIGEIGRYQKFLFCAMLPFGLFFAYVYFVQMFIAATPQRYWCHVPELAHLDLELRRNLSAPGAIEGEDWERCWTFQTNWSLVLDTMAPPGNDTPTAPCQHGYDFELTDIPYHTVVSERGWVCDKSSYAPMAQSIFFAGSFVGGLLFGWLADRFGRIPALVGSTMIGFVGGVATIYTNGIVDFTIARFLVGMAYDSCFMMIYILVLEYVGPRYRTLAANMSIALFFGAGCVSLPWLALGLADWRTLLWATSAPMLIVLAIPFTVPESVRWLVSRGRTNQAVRVFKTFEKINRTHIPQEVMDDFVIASRQTQNQKHSVSALFRSAPLRTMLAYMVAVYMCCALVFDGLVRLSESLGLDFFLTFTLASATEIPSVTLLALVMDRWGRRKLTVVPMGLSGALIGIAAFLPKGVPQTTAAVMARFFINMSYTAAIQWSTEMLPTGVRASGTSLVHVSGYVATVLSPFIVYSERYWSSLPLVIMSGLAVLAVGCGLMLPETMGRPMPQTIADGEKLVRNYTLCGKIEEIEEEALKEMNKTKEPIM